MVKIVQCVTRKSGMEAIDFRKHWMEYGSRMEALIRDRPNVVRFRLTTTLLVKETVAFMIKFGAATPFDGMVELWLDDAMIASANLRSDQEIAGLIEECRALLQQFVDPDKSTIFFAAEEMSYERPLVLESRS